MATSTTTFSERIARIEKRAETGQNTGYVTPGAAEDLGDKSPKMKRSKKARKPKGSYIGSIVGGVFSAVTIVAVGVAFLLADVEAMNFQDFASLLTSDRD